MKRFFATRGVDDGVGEGGVGDVGDGVGGGVVNGVVSGVGGGVGGSFGVGG